MEVCNMLHPIQNGNDLQKKDGTRKNSKGKQFRKRHSNRFIRRNKDVYHGKQYRKACDYHIYTSY